MEICGPARAGSTTRCVDYGSSIHILATQLLTLVDDHCHHRLSEVFFNITPWASRVCAVHLLLPGTILTSQSSCGALLHMDKGLNLDVFIIKIILCCPRFGYWQADPRSALWGDRLNNGLDMFQEHHSQVTLRSNSTIVVWDPPTGGRQGRHQQLSALQTPFWQDFKALRAPQAHQELVQRRNSETILGAWIEALRGNLSIPWGTGANTFVVLGEFSLSKGWLPATTHKNIYTQEDIKIKPTPFVNCYPESRRLQTAHKGLLSIQRRSHITLTKLCSKCWAGGLVYQVYLVYSANVWLQMATRPQKFETASLLQQIWRIAELSCRQAVVSELTANTLHRLKAPTGGGGTAVAAPPIRSVTAWLCGFSTFYLEKRVGAKRV